MPRYKELQERQERILARGTLTVALADNSLPPGVVGNAYIGQSGRLARYAVFGAAGFDDDVYGRVMSAALEYEMSHEEDTSPVTLTVHIDGTVEAQSTMHGHSAKLLKYTAHLTDRQRVSAPLLREATQSSPLLNASLA